MGESEPRRIEVDIGKIDLAAGRTEALRLLASPDGGVPTFLAEAARVASELFEDVSLDTVSDDDVSLLLHRIVETLAGMSVVGYAAVSIAAEATGVEPLEVLHRIEQNLEDE